MDSWIWQRMGDRSYLTCKLLHPLSHGFFTQTWWPSSPAELTTVLDAEAEAYRVKQVHGNIVLTPADVVAHHQFLASAVQSTSNEAENNDSPFPLADGLRSTDQQQALWVASADCTPALIADMATGAVAAVHAGWRGTAQEILPIAIRQMQIHGSQLSDLQVAMGPAISGEVYQVSTMVAAQVGRTLLDNGLSGNGLEELPDDHVIAILDQLQAIPDSPILEDNVEGRVRLDVRRVNQLQLQQLGLDMKQVAIAPYCTFQNPNQFFSYRRTREKKVQWSGIVSG